MIHTRRQTVTEAIVRTATAGMKEAEATNQAVWNDLFLPLSKKRVKDLGLNDAEKQKYVNRLTRMVEASGAPDKIVGGTAIHAISPSTAAEFEGNSRVLPSLCQHTSARSLMGQAEQAAFLVRDVRHFQLGDAVGTGVCDAPVPPLSGRPYPPAGLRSGEQ